MGVGNAIMLELFKKERCALRHRLVPKWDSLRHRVRVNHLEGLSVPSPAPTNCGASWQQQNTCVFDGHAIFISLETPMSLLKLANGWFETTSRHSNLHLAIELIVGGRLNLPCSNNIGTSLQPEAGKVILVKHISPGTRVKRLHCFVFD